MTNVNLLKRIPILLLIIIGLLPTSIALATDTPAAKVLVARGEVSSGRIGEEFRTLKRGDPVYSGETVATNNGEAQLRFSDGGLLTLYRNTRFVIDDYRYSKDNPEQSNAGFNLIKGLIHKLTGSIGKKNRDRYKIKTSMAVLGIRGTNFFMQLTNQLRVTVLGGGVELVNNGGTLPLGPGQHAQANGFDQLPMLTQNPVNPSQHRWQNTSGGNTNTPQGNNSSNGGTTPPQGQQSPPPPPSSPRARMPPPRVHGLEKHLKHHPPSGNGGPPPPQPPPPPPFPPPLPPPLVI